MSNKKISVIVPAYNEEKTVGKVLDVLTSSNIPDEVICVNDGSTDNTSNEIRKYKENINTNKTTWERLNKKMITQYSHQTQNSN